MKFYTTSKMDEDPNSMLWQNLIFWAMQELKGIDPAWETWYAEHITSCATRMDLYDTIKAHIKELRSVATITASAARVSEFNETHPRPEGSF